MTGAQIVTEILIEQGVPMVFGYPGGAVLDIYDALYAQTDRIRHYLTAHEQGATHAADGYARATGKTGVVLVTSGPGATNTVTGIATAFMDSIPMVIITANVGTGLIGRDSFQEVYIAGITMPITKHNYTVRDGKILAATLREAFRIAQSGRKGPVLVDIPKDILAGDCGVLPPVQAASGKALRLPEEATLREVADMLNRAERPVLCYGGGLVQSGAEAAMQALCEKGGIPCCNTVMATGVMGWNEPGNLGLLGMHGSVAANEAIDAADMVLAVGCRMSDRVALNMEAFAARAKIVQIDIDASEMRKNVAIGRGLVGDAKELLSALLPYVQPVERPLWQSQLAQWRAAAVTAPMSTQLHPYDVMEILGEMAGEDCFIVTDVGQHQMWAAQHCKKLRRRGFITSGGLGTMGFGYGAAIGTKLAHPQSTVVHITGDGSFHMNLCEACTAVSYGVKVISIVLDNRVLGMVRQLQDVYFAGRHMETEPYRATNFAAVGKGFGLATFEADTPAGFRAALEQALAAEGPAWISCAIDPAAWVLPMIPNGKTVREMIQ